MPGASCTQLRGAGLLNQLPKQRFEIEIARLVIGRIRVGKVVCQNLGATFTYEQCLFVYAESRVEVDGHLLLPLHCTLLTTRSKQHPCHLSYLSVN